MVSNNTDARQEITFLSGGIKCAADLYLQKGDKPRPAVVIGHGWAQTKQGLRNEARYIHQAGYNVMVIDYRTLGMSEGEPRGQIFPRRQVEDLRNAITYFNHRAEVDSERIAIYGVSFAGGLALQTAALDLRVKVCISQSPIVNGRRWMRDLRNSYDYHNLLLELQREFEESYGRPPTEGKKVKQNGPLAVAVPQNIGKIKPPFDPNNPNSCAYPVECQESYNEMICLDSIGQVLDFNPMDTIDLIAPRPLLVIGNAGGPYDWIHPPEPIWEAFAKAGEPKQLVFLPYDAYGLYQEPGRGESMALVISFLDTHLGK